MSLSRRFLLLLIIFSNCSCSNITSSTKNTTKNLIVDEKPIIKDISSKPIIKPNILKTVVVIYKNEYFVRIDEKNNKLKENDKIDYLQLTKLLEKYNIQKMIDSTTSEDIEELDRRQKILSEDVGVEVPHSMSMHYYSFPEESNVIELCKELNKFPFVSIAYVDYRGILT